MVSTTRIIGFNSKEIFWSNYTKHFLVKMKYPLEDYKTKDGGLILPLSDKSTILAEHYIKKGEIVSIENTQLTGFHMYAILVSNDGDIYLLHNEPGTRGGDVDFIAKIKLPKPTKGYTVLSAPTQDIGLALTISSEKYKDHISLLENFSSEFNTDYTSVEDDFYCVKLNELSNG